MSEVVPLAGGRSVYLEAYLAPFRPWLESEDVTEILVNRPGEVWIEAAGEPGMRRFPLPEADDLLLRRLAEQVARTSHQGINREHPLLSATLPPELCPGYAESEHGNPDVERRPRAADESPDDRGRCANDGEEQE